MKAFFGFKSQCPKLDVVVRPLRARRKAFLAKALNLWYHKSRKQSYRVSTRCWPKPRLKSGHLPQVIV